MTKLSLKLPETLNHNSSHRGLCQLCCLLPVFISSAAAGTTTWQNCFQIQLLHQALQSRGKVRQPSTARKFRLLTLWSLTQNDGEVLLFLGIYTRSISDKFLPIALAGKATWKTTVSDFFSPPTFLFSPFTCLMKYESCCSVPSAVSLRQQYSQEMLALKFTDCIITCYAGFAHCWHL